MGPNDAVRGAMRMELRTLVVIALIFNVCADEGHHASTIETLKSRFDGLKNYVDAVVPEADTGVLERLRAAEQLETGMDARGVLHQTLKADMRREAHTKF